MHNFRDYIEYAKRYLQLSKRKEYENDNYWLLVPSTIMAWTAIESYINNRLMDIQSLPTSYELHERAFLLEKRIHFHDCGEKLGEFSLNGSQHRRLEEKIYFIMAKTDYQDRESLKGGSLWHKFMEFKKARDRLVHPRTQDAVDLSGERVSQFIETAKEVINLISQQVWGEEVKF